VAFTCSKQAPGRAGHGFGDSAGYVAGSKLQTKANAACTDEESLADYTERYLPCQVTQAAACVRDRAKMQSKPNAAYNEQENWSDYAERSTPGGATQPAASVGERAKLQTKAKAACNGERSLADYAGESASRLYVTAPTAVRTPLSGLESRTPHGWDSPFSL
jgi:hypothetical protein